MISTGLATLDKFLGGGIAGGAIYDIFGPSATGKTQLAMQICANTIEEKIIFQDTTGTFRPERILQMIKARGLGKEKLDNITVARITNAAEQVASLEKIAELRPSLVVIDNISDLFSFEYANESTSLEKHVTFMKYMRKLSLACIQNKVPAVVTNSVRGTGEQERENLDKSISIFTHRKIRLSKAGTKFAAEVLPSFGPKKETVFEITPEGLVEAG